MTDDLISRSSLLEKINEMRKYGVNLALKVATDHIISEPAVDAEIVTRCKDCRHWGTGFAGETDKIKCCQFAGYMVGENGYCVYAEAKDTVGV